MLLLSLQATGGRGDFCFTLFRKIVNPVPSGREGSRVSQSRFESHSVAVRPAGNEMSVDKRGVSGGPLARTGGIQEAARAMGNASDHYGPPLRGFPGICHDKNSHPDAKAAYPASDAGATEH